MSERKLGVGVSGIGWCASQHIKAFLKNPYTEVRWLHGRDESRVRATRSIWLRMRWASGSADTLIGKSFIDFDTLLAPNPSAPAKGMASPATSTPVAVGYDVLKNSRRTAAVPL